MPEGGVRLASRRGVELIRTGQWPVSTGVWEAKSEDLAAAVAAMACPAIRRPVLKIGHTDQRFTGDGEPAIGWVDGLRVADGGHTLVGDYMGMPPWLDSVLASAYPDRSVEGSYGHRCQLGHQHPFVITAVALLGVTPPGVGTLRSLQDVQSLYGLAASAQAGSGTPVTFLIRASRKDPQVPSTRKIPPGVDPVDWALSTGRITEQHARYVWRDRLRDDPASTSVVLAALAEGTHRGGEQPAQQQVAATAFRPPTGAEGHYARNPFVEQQQRVAASACRDAEMTGQAPTLFESGDLPPFTASGIDPSVLMSVPWYGRHAVAAARTASEAQDLIEAMSGADGISYALLTHRQDMGNRDYEQRVVQWILRGTRVAAQREAAVEAQRVAASSAGEKPVEELTEDELYEQLHGHLDREREAQAMESDMRILEGRAALHGQDVAKVRARVIARAAGRNGEQVRF